MLTQMKIMVRQNRALAFLTFISVGSGLMAQQVDQANVDLDIKVEAESEAVGLKRLEIIEKILSTDLIEKRRALVKSVEQDYDRKITGMMKTLISPVIAPKVTTHIDVNFFSQEFESQVYSSQNVAVLIIIDRDVFKNWEADNNGHDMAVATLKQVISTTYAIPQNQVSIVLTR